jgi:hypothetical protein
VEQRTSKATVYFTDHELLDVVTGNGVWREEIETNRLSRRCGPATVTSIAHMGFIIIGKEHIEIGTQYNHKLGAISVHDSRRSLLNWYTADCAKESQTGGPCTSSSTYTRLRVLDRSRMACLGTLLDRLNRCDSVNMKQTNL